MRLFYCLLSAKSRQPAIPLQSSLSSFGSRASCLQPSENLQPSLAALAVSTPRGKCRVFPRKRFTFSRGRQGYRLHRPLSLYLPFPPPGKVPGISAKTVHFPPWLAGAPAPQAPLAALAVSTSGESAGFFRENGSLSPVADRGTGSTGPYGCTWHFHLPGKCREFPRKRFTFPRGRPGHRLHRPLSQHLPFPPPGKVPGFPAKTVHFPLGRFIFLGGGVF